MLLEKLKKDGGFTLTSQGKEYITNFGFQVGKRSILKVQLDTLTEETLGQLVNGCLDMVKPWEYLGGWVDKGLLYLDISVHVPHYSVAMELAKQHNQISIYDWSTGDCILCD